MDRSSNVSAGHRVTSPHGPWRMYRQSRRSRVPEGLAGKGGARGFAHEPRATWQGHTIQCRFPATAGRCGRGARTARPTWTAAGRTRSSALAQRGAGALPLGHGACCRERPAPGKRLTRTHAGASHGRRSGTGPMPISAHCQRSPGAPGATWPRRRRAQTQTAGARPRPSALLSVSSPAAGRGRRSERTAEGHRERARLQHGVIRGAGGHHIRILAGA